MEVILLPSITMYCFKCTYQEKQRLYLPKPEDTQIFYVGGKKYALLFWGNVHFSNPVKLSF